MEASNLLETQQAVPEIDNLGHLEDSRPIDRAREVGVVYEFAHPVVDETDDDRRKRQRQNQRRVTDEEKRLRDVVADLPPPPPAGPSQLEDSAYFAIWNFEDKCSIILKFATSGNEAKGSRNMCTCCRKGKKVPKVWSDENNMDPMSVPQELSGMSDAEQMLIARLAPTVHVHMFKLGELFQGVTALHSLKQCWNQLLFCHVSQQKWTSIYHQDGRFARHKVWTFIVHNIIAREHALEQQCSN